MATAYCLFFFPTRSCYIVSNIDRLIIFIDSLFTENIFIEWNHAIIFVFNHLNLFFQNRTKNLHQYHRLECSLSFISSYQLKIDLFLYSSAKQIKPRRPNPVINQETRRHSLRLTPLAKETGSQGIHQTSK